jgi:hypothetical protein
MELARATDAVCRVEVFKKDCYGEKEEYLVAKATGFFYAHQGKLYLITNKHVVLDKRSKVFMDLLRIYPTARGKHLTLGLRRDDGKPLWKEHPWKGVDVDVIALEIPEDKILRRWSETGFGVRSDDSGKDFSVRAFTEKDLVPEVLPGEKVPLGSFALVLGYPLGFYDRRHPDPIARLGIVSTVPWQDFEGEPVFLIDAMLHEGMSGSPVVSHPESPLSRTKVRECILDLSKINQDESEKKKLREFLSEILPALQREGYLQGSNLEWINGAKINFNGDNILTCSSPSYGPQIEISTTKGKVWWKKNSREKETLYPLDLERLEGNKLKIYKRGYGDVYLLGVYSSEWVVRGEGLGLQNVWHAKLIKDIISG